MKTLIGVSLALQLLTAGALITMCKGLYISKSEPYLDIFPYFDKHEMRKESFKHGCMSALMANKPQIITAKDYVDTWNSCLRLADKELARDSD